jgi:hypothetical protein
MAADRSVRPTRACRALAGWTDPLDPLKFKFLGFPTCQQPRKNASTANGVTPIPSRHGRHRLHYLRASHHRLIRFLIASDGIGRQNNFFEGLKLVVGVAYVHWRPFCRLASSNPVGKFSVAATQRGDCVVPPVAFLGNGTNPANYVPSCTIFPIISPPSPAEDVSSQDRGSTPTR